MNQPPEASREWIIQRCTQRWIGTELQYEDWPGPSRLKTREEMLEVLDYCNQQWPDDEFRGHNAMNCRCDKHIAMRLRVVQEEALSRKAGLKGAAAGDLEGE